VRRGLYRLRDYPSSPREEVVAAWLALGKENAVVSHASALDLLDLSHVIPDAVHLTVPRSRRHLPNLPGVAIHTTTRPLRPIDVVHREGARLTSAARTILDAAEAGTAPEQIERAVEQAIERG
jgi:predicted transcriptional regulator of viral defense system